MTITPAGSTDGIENELPRGMAKPSLRPRFLDVDAWMPGHQIMWVAAEMLDVRPERCGVRRRQGTRASRVTKP